MTDIKNLIRSHLREIVPYSTARDDFSGTAEIFLDANENPFGSVVDGEWNRYPDPYQLELKEAISKLKHIPSNNIFLGNGSDEPIDLIIRLFCEPGEDGILVFPPTYSMYSITAQIHNVKVENRLLTPDFELPSDSGNSSNPPKVTFICSPNNPTGNSFQEEDILRIIKMSSGIVVIDEAYIDFSLKGSFAEKIDQYDNLIVLQTFSKAWGLAGFRLGIAYANSQIIAYLNRIKAPYNLSGLVQKRAVNAINSSETVYSWIRQIIANRQYLIDNLGELTIVETVFPSDSNFLLVKFQDALEVFDFLRSKNIIVRDRTSLPLCENCLRITVGTKEENEALITSLKTFDNKA